jgi:hypothetical protein
MFMGMGMPIPDLSNLPGVSRPGAGPSGPSVDQIANQYSFEFDNSDSTYIRLTNFTNGFTSEANTNNGFSISFWFRTASIGVNYYIVGSGTLGDGPFTAMASGSNPRFRMRDSSSTLYTLTTNNAPVSTNTWFHIAYVWDGTAAATDRMKIYVNGVQNTSVSITGPTSLQTSGTNYSTDSLIGAYRGDVSNPGPGGDIYIDEVGIFTRSLSDEDVKVIYDATTSGMTADLSTLSTGAPYAWYRMGD